MSCASLPYMSIRTRIVIAISFHQIDNAPNAKTCANSHNESLQNGNRLIKEFHMLFSPDRRFDECLRFQKESGLAHLRCCPLPAILASPFIFNKVSLLESHDRWWLFRVGHTDHLSGSARTGGRVYLLLLICTSLSLCLFGHIHFIKVKFFRGEQSQFVFQIAFYVKLVFLIEIRKFLVPLMFGNIKLIAQERSDTS